MIVENYKVGESLEPTPGFDCHLSTNVNIDLASVSLKEAYESTQVIMLLLLTSIQLFMFVIVDHG